MDSKEIKNKLKNAREAIRNKEFKEALKSCKAVLSEDGNHYMALVLVAVAAEGLEQHDQALKAYKRAITCDDAQALAWQGLSGFYEKHPSPEYRPDQLDVYIKLCDIHASDRQKCVDVLCKMAKLIDGKTDPEKSKKVVTLYETIIEQETDVSQRRDLQKTLISVLQRSLLPDTAEQIVELSKSIVMTVSEYDDSVEGLICNYLSGLVRKCPSDVFKISKQLHQQFPASVAALEHVLISHLDAGVDQSNAPNALEMEELQCKADVLVQMTDGGSVTLLTVLGYIALCKKDYQGARNQLSKALNQSTKLVCPYYYQSVVHLCLHQYEASVKFTSDGMRALGKKDRFLTCSSTGMSRALNLIQVKALCSLGTSPSLRAAMDIIDKELDRENEYVTIQQGHVHLKLGDIDKATSCVVGESVQRLILEGLVHLKEQHIADAITKFESVVEREPDSGVNLFYLAKCLWMMPGRKQECFPLLLKAAKLDPYFSETFLYLGHYYSQSTGDQTRARKCYQKSYDLDPNSDEAGAAVCDLLTKEDEAQAHKILLDVTSKASAGCAKWAWLRLGLYQVKNEDPSVAISSFQAALRADPKDNHVWECLGEAYYARGSYTASLKAFTKASELDPQSMYCLFQMASIKQTLGTYKEAIEEYKVILDRSPNYVPALKGIGETYLLVAKSSLSRYFHGRARDTAQVALQHLTKAASARPDLSCLWKLMGDACTILHVLPPDSFSFQKPDGTVLSKLQTLEAGGRYYARALKIVPECSSLWHDLGVNYVHQSECLTSDAALLLADKSVQALKKAIQLEPTNHRHWIALGFAACTEVYNKPSLAQHCFIKSIQVDSNNVVAWTNLAALYLKHDNIKLAHEAFKIAQSLEPSYVSCWIGQAIIAEVVGHEDAMDLFRHTTELGNHLEGALGYSHWVCKLLQNHDTEHSYIYTYAIEQMAAVPAASDALARYTDRVHTNPVAYNMYGLLLERQKLYSTAATNFRRGIELLNGTPDKQELLLQLKNSYARTLSLSGNYQGAVRVYADMDQVEGFENLCQMALTFYKTGKYQESVSAYAKALEVAPTDADKSDVSAAVAMVLYKTGNVEETKTTLFQSFQMSEPSVAGLKALCALGLIQSDITLATAAIQELSKTGGSNSDSVDTMVLAVTLDILQGNMVEAKRRLQRLLHARPNQAELWHLLSTILLRHFPHLGVAVTQAAKSAQVLQKCGMQEYQQIAIGQLSAGYHSKVDINNNALTSAQRAVLLYPDQPENWATLAASVHAEAVQKVDYQRRQSLLHVEYDILTSMLAQGTVSAQLRLWCHKQRVICSIHLGRQGDTVGSLDALLGDFGSEEDVKVLFEVLKNVLQGDRQSLLNVVSTTDIPYYWQIVVELYLNTGLVEEVESAMQMLVSHSMPRSTQLVTLVKLTHAVFRQILAGDDSSSLRQLFDEYSNRVLGVYPNCAVVMVMQGILSLQDNPRLTKHKVHEVVYGHMISHMTGGRSFVLSIARKLLVYVLVNSKKDSELLQRVLQDAEQNGDISVLDYHKSLVQQLLDT